MLRPGFRLFTVILSCMPLGIVISTATAQEEPAYVGHTQCKLCHNKKSEGEQWNKWKAMQHANAFTVLSTPEAQEAATKTGLDTAPSESPECLRCHVTGYDLEKKLVPVELKKEDGVQCETCHGPGSSHLDDGKKLLFKKDIPGVDVSANLVEPDETLCKTCHNDQNPTWNPEKYTLENGEKVGFDFKQAWAKIAHSNPTKQEEPAK